MVRFNDKKQATELSPEDILIMTDVSDSSNDKKVTMNQMANYVAGIVPSNLPSQEGHSGQYLTTDGTEPSWADVSSLPSQSGQAGKYLYSDGVDATWRSAYAPPLLSFDWYDHKLNDVRFLRADTFSWQSGEVYTAVYQKLLDEYTDEDCIIKINADVTGTPTVTDKGIVSGFSTTKYLSKSITLGTTKEEIFPIVFDFATGTNVTTEQAIFQIGTWCVYLKLLNGKLYLSLGDGTAWSIVDSQEGTSTITANTSYEAELDYDGSTYTLSLQKTSSETPVFMTDISFASSTLICTGAQTLNIGTTATHTNPFLGQIDVSSCAIDEAWHGTFGKTSPNGFIILDDKQEIVALNDYNLSGVAWYYILDTTNQRFKLPRTKYGFVGLRDSVGNVVNIATTGTSTKATQMYLYFYVGDYTQDAIEQTAGLNAELFAEKLDKNLSNLDAAGQAKFDAKASTSLNNLSSAGQAILDRKVEVEALLAQNGYAKFTWKEGNKTSKLIVQWGLISTVASSAPRTVSFNTVFNSVLNVSYMTIYSAIPEKGDSVANVSNSSFKAYRVQPLYWFALGT